METLEFLSICSRLKKTKRTGWVNHKIDNPESIADHMHRMGIISLLIKDDSIDRNRLVKMAIVHDLAEAIVGDITPDDGISKQEKFKLELDAMESFVQLLGNSEQALEILQLWKEYEDGETETALVCKDIDKFEMILQAYEYELEGFGPLDSFFQSTMGKFKHPEIIRLVSELYKKRDSSKSKQ